MAEVAIESTVNEAPSEATGEVEMEVETRVSTEETNGAEGQAEKVNGGTKRERGDEGGEEEEGNSKKAKVERSVEEKRLDKIEEEKKEEADGDEGVEEEEEEIEKEDIKEAKLGPKLFTSSEDMFDYFFKLLHNWAPNLDINKYEHMVLMDLLKKGHNEPERKIGKGIEAFEVRSHPVYKSRCFFVRRVDGSSDDFSFRKCVDSIMPLPDELKIKPDSNFRSKKGGRGGGGRGGGGGGGGRRGRRGRGRGRG